MDSGKPCCGPHHRRDIVSDANDNEVTYSQNYLQKRLIRLACKSSSNPNQRSIDMQKKIESLLAEPAGSQEDIWTSILIFWNTAKGPRSWRMRRLSSLILEIIEDDARMLQGLPSALKTAGLSALQISRDCRKTAGATE